MVKTKYYTPQDIADMFKIKIDTVWSWIRKGTLKSICVGRQYRISEESLNEFIKTKNSK